MDSNFGKSLAAQSVISSAQALAAKKMLKKYRRQLPPEIYGQIVTERKKND